MEKQEQEGQNSLNHCRNCRHLGHRNVEVFTKKMVPMVSLTDCQCDFFEIVLIICIIYYLLLFNNKFSI